MLAARSRLLLIASTALLFAFFCLTWSYILLWPLPIEGVRTALQFLNPGIKNNPDGWLFGTGLQLLLGPAGLMLFGRAISNRWPWGINEQPWAQVARSWKQVIWAILLGQFVVVLVGAISRLGVPQLGGRSILTQFLQWYGYLLPVAGLVVCVRLLYGRGPRRIDKWVGFIAAATALFSLAWMPLTISGFGFGVAGLPGSRDASIAGMFARISEAVYLGAAAGAGLALARPAKARPLALTSSPLIIGYSVLAAVVLGLIWSNLSQVWVFQLLPGNLPLIYGVIVTACVCGALMCLLQALGFLYPAANRQDSMARTAPSEGVPSGVDPLRARRSSIASLPLTLRFWLELLGSLAVSCGFLVLGYQGIGIVPLEVTPFIFPLMIFVVFVGPIVVFVFGALCGRPGIAIGGILVLVGILGYRFMNLQIAQDEAKEAVEEATALNILPFGAPSRSYQIVVIQDSFFNRSDGTQRGCAELCQQILLNSSYSVAIPDQDTQEWRLYRKANGQARCTEPAQIDTYLGLLAHGVPDTCIVATRQKPGADALVLDEDLSHDATIWKSVSSRVHGAAYEFYERQNGVDTLLGRVIAAGVQPPLLSGQEVQKTRIQMRDFEFYAAALRLPIRQYVEYKVQDLPEVITTLEGLFHDAVIGKKAQEAFRSLSILTRDARAAEVMRTTVLRFWESNDPELIALGLQTLYRIREFGVDFAKPFVVGYMDSQNTDIMKAAVGALSAYGRGEIGAPVVEEADIEFAKVSLGNVILSERVAAYGDEYGTLVEMMKRVPGAFPEEMRISALEQLRVRSDLVPDRFVVLLGIVARGTASNRQDAIDWIFNLRDKPFEEAVKAVGRDADVLTTGIKIKFWSESEIEELVRRAEQVPDDRLIGYLRSFRHQMSFRDQRGAMEDLLEERIDKLNADTDKKLLRQMKEFLTNLNR